ncbi:RHS repeat-associated core domain-containing protein [Streptomyces viridosporus]|uniref:RHS repeat-associated core domain-containing protein n=1 Tax=Streptomyces viridosporus TaxID=67581 RepID=UPI0021004BD6|nr:RHS repeat-associated core domain-containing protein [Streptomyces viridosporus]
MLDIVGVGWPNVDEDAYRDMADALREFADDAEDDGHAAHQYIQRLLSTGRGESLTALDKHWSKVQRKHKDLAKAARIIAGALDRVADIIVARKIAAVGELADLCATVGVTLAFAPVTAGLSTLLAGAKIAATRIAFKRILKEMAEDAVAEIVATLTQPAVAAIENVVADLAIQTALNVAGVQDGYNTGQTVQAGKDGLQLNSAGAPAGAGGGLGIDIDHDAHGKTGLNLANVQIAMQGKTKGKLSKARGAHGRAKGKDSLTAVLDSTIDGVTEKLSKALDDLGDHVGKKLPDAIKGSSKAHRDTDHAVRDRVRSIKVGDREGMDGPGGRAGDLGPGGARRGAGDGRPGPDRLDEAKKDARRNAISLRKTTCATDPIDVATGEMVLPQTDLSLPGVLPLVLCRVHLSEYRFGRWFGRSWASTLDERIELDTRGLMPIWAREDGSVLIYPRLPGPEDREGVLPLEGPRLALMYTGRDNAVTTYQVFDPVSGVTRFFSGSPYHESSAYWLSEVQDRNRNGVTFMRRGDGAPVAVVHSGGYRVAVTVEGDRVNEIALRTPEGRVTVRRFGYDPEGNLEAVVNSSGLPVRYTYDADARITSWTDRNDSAYHYVYDDAGRVVRTIGPEGFLSSAFVYEADNEIGDRITRYTDSTGATTVFHLNSRHQVVAETDPLGHTTQYAFDTYDRILAVTDPLGHTTRLERDDAGSVIAMTAPDGERTTAVYNDQRLPIEIVERGGMRFRYEYDAAGNRTAAISSVGERTEYVPDSTGAVSEIRPTADRIVRITNNAAGLPVTVTAANGTATCVRDAFGRITAVTDAEGGTLRQGWTVDGQLSWRELPDGSREEWTWDGEGNLLTHTDRMGRTTTHSYTHFDLPADSRGAEESGYTFAHDSELRLTKVTDTRGREWTYDYDRAGRLVRETDFDGRTLTYQHDAAGRLIRRINAAGQSLAYTRDVLGRIVQVSHGDSAVTAFSYAPTGRLQEVTNAEARVTFETDGAGRIVAETVNGHTFRYAYDAQGRRTWRRTPCGAESSLEYGPEGLSACMLGEHTFRFVRDRLGREISRTLDDSLTMRQDWDPVGRITRHRVSSLDTEILERVFTYQPDGAPVGINDSILGRRTFTLDTAGRITGVQARGWSEQYSYNTAGDQAHAGLPTSAPGQDSIGERLYDSTRLVRSGRTRYTYDAQGRLTERSVRTLSGKLLSWTFLWDAEDRLMRVQAPDGTIWRYLYDGLGRRIAKIHQHPNGTVIERIEYGWDGTQLAEQRTGATVLVWDYAGLYPFAQRETKHQGDDQQDIDRRFFAIVTDLTGSPNYMISPGGSVAWRARSTAWGATQWNSDATAYTPLRYPGQYFDPETGLHYNVHRYYDPQTGRYISPDPLGLAPAANHYAYVPNPFTMADPLGLAGCSPDHTWGGKVVFVQDEHGRPSEMHATVTRDMLNEGTEANNSLRPPGFVHGTDHNQARGHMLARMLGGTGDDLDNLFTLTQNPTNSPHMRDLEQSIYDAVAGDPAKNIAGQIVQYSVYLEYTDDRKDSVPSRIYMQADGSNGFRLDTDFANPDHAAQQNRRRLGIP